ncbi:hypothetical protein F5X97DRAFT_309521 [Nemania serpens]|nr:hypothetical protein F5X97DRAFT_309521 [Nemania serpens]
MAIQTPNTLDTSHGPSYIENQPGKRRAEDYLSYSSSKRCRVSKISSVPLWCQPPPHPLSVTGLIRKHCGNRLYVHPLQWTAQHLELLGYRFVRKGNEELRAHSQHQNSLQLPSEAIMRRTTFLLRMPCLPEFNTTFIIELLAACNVIQLDRSRLPFDFKRQTIATVPTSGIFAPCSNTATFAFLNLACVQSERDRSIGLSMSRKLVGPVRRIRRKRQQRLQPSNEAEDPYIAAVLIALAQGLQHQHQHQQQKQTANGPNDCLESVPAKLDPTVLPQQTATDIEVRLLALARDALSLYFYKASIPSKSLDMLNEPSHYHDANVVQLSYHVIRLNSRENLFQNIHSIISSL